MRICLSTKTHAANNPSDRCRPYYDECTGSLLNSEVKRRKARLVLGSGTAWEPLRVLTAFCLCFLALSFYNLFHAHSSTVTLNPIHTPCNIHTLSKERKALILILTPYTYPYTNLQPTVVPSFFTHTLNQISTVSLSPTTHPYILNV